MKISYQTAVSIQEDDLWESFSTKTFCQAAEAYLNTLSFHTKRAYRCGFRKIFQLFLDKGLMQSDISLQALALSNMENLLDCIKTHLPGSESTKQGRCGLFISFTKYLERVSGGMIRSAKPLKGTQAATFRKIRSKAATVAITHEEWHRFLRALRSINRRDSIIAKALFQGAKRVSEVLSATIDQINWEKNQICYKQSKSFTLVSTTTINYSPEFMAELKDYLNGRDEGLIFVTRNGQQVTQPHVHRSFSHASVQANLKVRVHPHVLRTTAITLLMGMGHHSDQIMKVSGHATPGMVLYYDKSAEEENPTKYTKLC